MTEKKLGRPRKELTDKDWQTIEAACKIQCTGEEIASLMDMDYDTLNARIYEKFGYHFSDYIKTLSASGKASLRRLQWKAAEGGNTTMLVWLGKQHLGQSDKQELTGGNGQPLMPPVIQFIKDDGSAE